ncbi:MAG: P-II family nitrogen regulator [Chloroflexi bacterium]|nr:P-II family nitrogen regulator [Chloroflexota bacterium]
MKLVTARIRPDRLEPVHAALMEIGISNLTATEVKGFGPEVDHAEIHRGAQYQVAFMPMVKIESVVTDDLVAQVVATIREASTTGQADRSHIWVSGVLSEETGEAKP